MSKSNRRSRAAASLRELVANLHRVGARLEIHAPGLEPLRVGVAPDPTRVVFRTTEALTALTARDHLTLAEAYLRGDIDVEGDLSEVMKISELIDFGPTWVERLRLAAKLLLRNRLAYDRESIAFHYDRPVDFFLPWFDRWRSYSHGFYATPDESPSDAQARKLQYAIDALGLEPGMHVFDMGAGWGPFLEYAGLRGISVHGITISDAQYRFLTELIRARNLPCTIELVNLFEYRSRTRFQGAVLMGTLEHVPEYRRVAEFLAEHLAPGARIYADFCSVRRGFTLGAFMKKHIWPGAIQYVDTPRLIRELLCAGFNLHELADDTRSYACTVRDWADALEAKRVDLAARFGEASVRAFLLFLRGSHYFLSTNRTQAYHLLAGRDPAPLRRQTSDGTRQ